MMPLGTLLLALVLPALQDPTPGSQPPPTPADQEARETEPEEPKPTDPLAGTEGPSRSAAKDPHATKPLSRSTGKRGQSRGSMPPSATDKSGADGQPEPKKERNTSFFFSPPQKAQRDPSIVWSRAWYSMDDPEGAGAEPALVDLPQTARRIHYAIESGRTILVRDLVSHESLYDAFAADEESMARYGEFIVERDASLSYLQQKLLFFECAWQAKESTRRVLALYSLPENGELRSIWILGEPGAGYDELMAEVQGPLARLLGPLCVEQAASYNSILGAHALAFNLYASGDLGDGEAALPIVLKAVDAPREGEADYIESITEVNPQFSHAVIQNWIDQEQDVALSYQVIGYDNGLGVADPFVQWLGGQFQRAHRDNKELGDFPVEQIHDPRTLTQVISPSEVESHYQRNKRAPDFGVILGVTLTRSPYAASIQTYWMNTAGETPVYGYARMVGLRQYVRSRSETIMRNSVAMLMLSGSDPVSIERMAAALQLRTLPLDADLRLPH